MLSGVPALSGLRVAAAAAVLLLAVASGAQMVTVPAGTFTMGAAGGEPDESPAHSVNLAAYKIDSREVTRRSYDSCVSAGACSPPHDSDGRCIMWTSQGLRKVSVPPQYRSPDYPVVCVSWNQAREYCRFRKKKLPTEAQWERAALAGGTAPYAWGTQQPSPATCAQPSQRHASSPARHRPNGWGLYDMTGNVWEWVYDRYQPDYYAVSEKSDPTGPSVGRYRVVRGGGWYSTAAQLRIRNRQWFVPEYGEVSVGFRCVQ